MSLSMSGRSPTAYRSSAPNWNRGRHPMGLVLRIVPYDAQLRWVRADTTKQSFCVGLAARKHQRIVLIACSFVVRHARVKFGLLALGLGTEHGVKLSIGQFVLFLCSINFCSISRPKRVRYVKGSLFSHHNLREDFGRRAFRADMAKWRLELGKETLLV
jgi:hypothetical protein